MLSQAIPKDQKKGVMPFANFVIKGDVKARGKEALELELPFDERSRPRAGPRVRALGGVLLG